MREYRDGRAVLFELPVSTSKDNISRLVKLLNLQIDNGKPVSVAGRRGRNPDVGHVPGSVFRVIEWAEEQAGKYVRSARQANPHPRLDHRLIGDEDEGYITRILAENARHYQDKVRECADTWLACGCDFRAWSLRAVFQSGMERYSIYLDAVDGRPVISLVAPSPRYKDWYPLSLFLGFLLSRYCHALGRCARCEDYFVNTSGKEKRFCSQRCASADSAQNRIEEKRASERMERRIRIQTAIDGLTYARKKPDSLRELKLRVQSEAGADISMNIITRLLKTGEISVPRSLMSRLVE